MFVEEQQPGMMLELIFYCGDRNIMLTFYKDSPQPESIEMSRSFTCIWKSFFFQCEFECE